MLAQAENLGSEFHETKNAKCSHAEMLASGFLFLHFFGHYGVPDTSSTGFYWLQFVPHTQFLLNF